MNSRGGVFVCGSIFFGAAPSTGWFMYPPLATSEQAGIGADIWLLGLSFIEVASLAAAVEFIVGIMKCRAPSMQVNPMPLFAWCLLIVPGMILFAVPPLIAGDLLFEMQRMFDWPFFDPDRGGESWPAYGKAGWTKPDGATNYQRRMPEGNGVPSRSPCPPSRRACGIPQPDRGKPSGSIDAQRSRAARASSGSPSAAQAIAMNDQLMPEPSTADRSAVSSICRCSVTSEIAEHTRDMRMSVTAW